MGSGASSANAHDLMDKYGAPDGKKSKDTASNRHAVAVAAVSRLTDAAGASGSLPLEEAVNEILAVLHNKPDRGAISELLSGLVDGEGSADVKAFEAAAASVAEEADNGSFLHKEVQQEVARFGAVFGLLMEKLRWCDQWTDESRKVWWGELKKNVKQGSLVVNHHDEYGNTMLIIAAMGRR